MNNQDLDDLLKQSQQLVGNCSGLYFLFDEAELVYIGKGWNCLLRVAEHTRKDSNKKFSSWNFIPFHDDRERDEQEKLLIQSLQPKYNKTFK